MASYLCRVKVTDIYNISVDAADEKEARDIALSTYIHAYHPDCPDDWECAVDVLVEDPTSD